MSEKKKMLRLRKDPVLFVKTILKATPEKWQAEALKAVVTNDRISIKSGHGVGKSTYLSWAILWFLLTRYPAKIACTAPTAHQLQDVLWGELSKWYQKLPEYFRESLILKSDRLELAEAPASSFCVARTARRETPEAFQGFHSENMLFLVDEASGVDEKIFEVGAGAMSTKNAKTILCSNPTRTSGYFYDSHTRSRAHWKRFTVSCSDSSQVSEDYINEMRDKYSDTSSIFAVRVLGNFPESDDESVIGLSLIESAVNRQVTPNPKAPIVWGLDPARFGSDRTALCKVQANVILEPIKTWRNKDLMQTCGLVLDEYKKMPDEFKPVEIIVDSIGLGAGVVDRMMEIGLPVRGLNVGEAPCIDDKTYMRRRDELWFKAKEWFQDLSVSIPDDQELVAELASPQYSHTSSGRLKVEGKDEMKKRGIASPDKADAFCLCLGYEQAYAKGHSFTRDIEYPEIAIV